MRCTGIATCVAPRLIAPIQGMIFLICTDRARGWGGTSQGWARAGSSLGPTGLLTLRRTTQASDTACCFLSEMATVWLTLLLFWQTLGMWEMSMRR